MSGKNKVVFLTVFLMLGGPFWVSASDLNDLKKDLLENDSIVCLKNCPESEKSGFTGSRLDFKVKSIGINSKAIKINIQNFSLGQRKMIPSAPVPSGPKMRESQPGSYNQEGEHQTQTKGLDPGDNSSSQIRASRLNGSIPPINQQNNQIDSGGGADSYMAQSALMNRGNRLDLTNNTQNRNKNKRGQALGRTSPPQGSSPDRSSGHSAKRKTKKKSLLSRIATSLGFGKYFGSSGNQRHSGRYNRRNYNYQKNNRRIQKNSSGQLKTPSDILKERLNRKFKRGLANQLEFETSRTSLFQKMCEHYNNYTRKNNIPDSRRHCPK